MTDLIKIDQKDFIHYTCYMIVGETNWRPMVYIYIYNILLMNVLWRGMFRVIFDNVCLQKNHIHITKSVSYRTTKGREKCFPIMGQKMKEFWGMIWIIQNALYINR